VDGVVQLPHQSATREDHVVHSRLGWQLTLFSAGLLYTAADLVLNLDMPVLGVTIALLLARELIRRDRGRET
jgi:DMSO reductase anchor subunit